MSNLTLLIPANKEAESLPVFLKELKNFDYNILVVLQEEDKETIDAIRNFEKIEVLTQKKRGYGSALKEGIENINTEFFCIINADGSMDPNYLKEMHLLCKNFDFIFASRYLSGGGSDDDNIVTFVGNKFFSFLGNFLFGLNLSDILYTFIVGKTQSAKELYLKYHDFRICVEIPIIAKIKELNFSSIPSKERKRIAGVKKVNALRDGFLILIAIIHLFIKKNLNK